MCRQGAIPTPICNLIFVPVPTSNSDPIPTSNCDPIPNATPLLTCVSILTSVLILIYLPVLSLSFPGVTVVKNLLASIGDTRDAGLIPGLGRSPGGGNGNPLQYSCLENSMDRGAW